MILVGYGNSASYLFHKGSLVQNFLGTIIEGNNCDLTDQSNLFHKQRRIKVMKTSRQDIERNKSQSRCPNATTIGYSTYKLRHGDLFLYREDYTDGTHGYRLAKCHGSVKPNSAIGDEKVKWYILAQAADDMKSFTYERWVDPKNVVKTCPAKYADKNILNFFKETEE